MPKRARKSRTDWSKVDAHEITAEEYEEAPEWTDDQIARAELAIGGKVVRPARGTFKRGPGRPKVDAPKKSVHLRLSQDVLAYFRKTGPGWQTRIDETLRKAAKLGIRKG
ncbi:MAG TPA: BrnA antitoxin family protein [Rhizomicrobium sp.]|nr:BrnA antitoxin family protein [Rhizomicrobium sp.]